MGMCVLSQPRGMHVFSKSNYGSLLGYVLPQLLKVWNVPERCLPPVLSPAAQGFGVRQRLLLKALDINTAPHCRCLFSPKKREAWITHSTLPTLGHYVGFWALPMFRRMMHGPAMLKLALQQDYTVEKKIVSSASGVGKAGQPHVNQWSWNTPSHHTQR